MSTFPMNGTLPQWAKYIGEFVPSDDNVEYFYRVVAYNRSREPITIDPTPPPKAWGPIVLDERHLILIRWQPVIGASFFAVFKEIGGWPSTNIDNAFWIATATETGIADNGYPVGTRGYDLNPGISPLFMRQMPCPPKPEDKCRPCPDDPCKEDDDDREEYWDTGGL